MQILIHDIVVEVNFESNLMAVKHFTNPPAYGSPLVISRARNKYRDLHPAETLGKLEAEVRTETRLSLLLQMIVLSVIDMSFKTILGLWI